MTIELALVISVASFVFTLYSGVTNLKRNKASDDKREATDLTTVIVKLETIGKDTSEIKMDLRSLKNDVQKNTEQIIRLDESLKSVWKRVNSLEGQIHGGHAIYPAGKPEE